MSPTLDALFAALDWSPVPTTFVDRALRCQFANRAHERWSGLSRSEVIGKPMMEVVGGAASETVRPYVDAALGGATVEFESTMPFRGRGDRRMRVVYSAVRGADGLVAGFVAYLEDLTLRRDAEAAVATVLDGLADGYLAVSNKLRFAYVNDGAARFYGRPPEEIFGREVEEVFPGSLKGPGGRVLLEVMRTGRAQRHVLPSSGAPGKLCMVDFLPLPMGGVGCVIQDLTETDGSDMPERRAADPEPRDLTALS